MPRITYEITFLGTGTSIGIPVPGCGCAVCLSRDRRNRRRRCAILIRADSRNILIDTPPEFRLQALDAGIDRLDAVFWTHGHADHLHGLDDLRALTWDKPLEGYASKETNEEIATRFSYLWKKTQKGGGKAKVNLNNVEPGESIRVGNLTMRPVPVLHGRLGVYGWRCGPVAYVTDVSKIPESSYDLLKNLKILILGALRFEEHPTHFSVGEALDEIKKIGPEEAYLTHINHSVSHRNLLRAVHQGVRPARDGLRLRAVGDI